MPHSRSRHATSLLLKKLKFAPVVAIQGARQTGKFLILGSTEFSKPTLYSLNIAEALELPPNPSKELSLIHPSPRVTRAQLMHHLDRGGMPGIFAVRSASERETLLRDWLDLTTQRDALLFPKIKIDPDLCQAILTQVARLEDPDAGNIAKALKTDLRKIKTHLSALIGLFVLHPLAPHPSSSGKTQYFLCDVAFARLLGADFERQLYTWLIHEQLSQRAYRDDRDSTLYFYRTPKGRRIHLLVENARQLAAIKIFPEERVLERDMATLKALKERHQDKQVLLFGLASARYTFPVNGARDSIEIYPWESLG
jgi:predicted AAA+ superfamily ATPase